MVASYSTKLATSYILRVLLGCPAPTVKLATSPAALLIHVAVQGAVGSRDLGLCPAQRADGRPRTRVLFGFNSTVARTIPENRIFNV